MDPEEEDINTISVETAQKRVDELNVRLNKLKKRLKPSPSFDAGYFETAKEMYQTTSRKSSYNLKILQSDENVTVDEEHLTNLQTKIEADKNTARIYGRQAKRLKDTPKLVNTFRSYVDLYLTSSFGPRLNLGPSGRDSSDQSNLRQTSIDRYSAQYPKKSLLWCPVLGDWTGSAICAHIIPAKTPDRVFQEIFGTEERMDPLNTMILHDRVEKRFDKHLIAIVPDLDSRSPDSVRAWMDERPHQYRIKVIQPNAPDMIEQPLVDSEITWTDYLENRKLKFRSNFRPRNRYLYFHYAICILNLSYYSGRKISPLHTEEMSGMAYWGTGGRWMRQSMLVAFIEDAGSDYLRWYTDEVPEEEREDEGVLAANNVIRDKHVDEDEGSEFEDVD